MSVLPWMTSAPSFSSSRRPSTASAGSGPLRTWSPATSTWSGLACLMAFRTAASAVALPWTSLRTARRVIGSPQDAFARDDEAQCGLAGDLAVDAGDGVAAPEARAQLLHRDLEAEGVARCHDAL